MVEFWEAEQELEFDVHDMILSKNASEKKQSSISQTSLKWLNFWHHFVFPHFSTRNIKKAKNWKKT